MSFFSLVAKNDSVLFIDGEASMYLIPPRSFQIKGGGVRLKTW